MGPDGAAGLAPAYFNMRKTSIYGGTNEIQRNIIARMVLGLVKEPRARRGAGVGAEKPPARRAAGAEKPAARRAAGAGAGAES